MTWKNLKGEIDAHIEEKALELIESGVPEQEAWQRARRDFGNPTLITESSRAVWIWTWIERLWQDLVYARRMLAKHPAFTTIAVLSLALGVGANCAMFSLADALLLRPLPVPHPGEVMTVGSTMLQGATRSLSMSYPDFRDFRAQNRSFAALGGYDMVRVRFEKRPGDAVAMQTGFVVTGNFFDTMQVKPALGRVFEPREDEAPGRDAVLVLSHAFWVAQFDADPGILGRAVRIDDLDFTIVGVLPAGFISPDQWVQPDFYVPVMMWPRLLGRGSDDPLESRLWRSFEVKGRLKGGVTLEQARAEAAVIGQALARQYPDADRNFAIDVRTELRARVGEEGPIPMLLALMLLLAAAVLLVSCANVAGLLTSRAPARAREMSVRLAIGAGRTRLIRQLLTESLLLAVLGAGAGIGVGYAGVRFLRQMNEYATTADVPLLLSFRLDERVLLFSLAAAAASVFLFGLAPAWRTARAGLTDALRAPGSAPAGSSGRPRLWTRNVLVAGQVALSMVLLTVAGILYVTFHRELLAGPGFRADHTLIANFETAVAGYGDSESRIFYRDLVERAREIPGVRSAALASGVPASDDLESISIVPENFDLPEGQTGIGIVATRVGENYFATLGIPILRGREFAATDDADSMLVAIVNQAAADQYWPRQNPLGKRIRWGDGPWRTIVGVAKTGKYQFVVERDIPFLYLPYAQVPRTQMTLVLESAGDPAGLAAPLRDLVRRLDPTLPAFAIRTLEHMWNARAVNPSLLIIKMAATMGGMGVLLALTGLYGLMAYSVSARRREIGIRMAVGAQKSTVLRMILRQGFVLAASGTILGFLLSAAVGRMVEAAFPTHHPSPIIFIVVVPAVFAVTMLAAFLPARRASQVDPVDALRQE